MVAVWRTTSYACDALNRPVTVNYPEGTPDVSFAYSNYGHNVSMTDGTGVSTWVYDSWRNLSSFASPQGATINYTYNRLGERLTMNDGGSANTTYEYDNFGRMKKLTNRLNEVTQWDYDDDGRVMKRTLGNGTWEDINYDNRSRPTSITLAHSRESGHQWRAKRTPCLLKFSPFLLEDLIIRPCPHTRCCIGDSSEPLNRSYGMAATDRNREVSRICRPQNYADGAGGPTGSGRESSPEVL